LFGGACEFVLPAAAGYFRGEVNLVIMVYLRRPCAFRYDPKFMCRQCFPNPFKSSCTFELYVLQASTLPQIVDVSGKTVYNGSTLAKSGATQFTGMHRQ
jgi:hypothetical protein